MPKSSSSNPPRRFLKGQSLFPSFPSTILSLPPPHRPKPRAIFTPGIDQLNKVIRAKDAAIDHILRPPKPVLPKSLPEEDEKFVQATLANRAFVSKVAREQVGFADIYRLRPREWLNDEVINFYGALINARAEASAKGSVDVGKGRGKPLKAFYFSSFFWTKLSGEGYEKGKLDRWTKKAKVDIFEKEILVMPINHRQTHWTAGAVNFGKKRFESYDSMGIAKEDVTKVCARLFACFFLGVQETDGGYSF